MVDTATKKLTKAEFWVLADAADITYELIDGSNYLAGGVLQVWVVDPAATSITVFYLDRAPVTYMGNGVIKDDLFPELAISLDRIF